MSLGSQRAAQRKLMGNYTYMGNVSRDPLIDKYQSGGTGFIYVLTIPDEIGRTGSYTIDLGKVKSATLFTPKPGANEMTQTELKVVNGKVTLPISETPSFVRVAL